MFLCLYVKFKCLVLVVYLNAVEKNVLNLGGLGGKSQ